MATWISVGAKFPGCGGWCGKKGLKGNFAEFVRYPVSRRLDNDRRHRNDFHAQHQVLVSFFRLSISVYIYALPGVFHNNNPARKYANINF